MTPEERAQATAFVRALGELVNEGTEDVVSKASEWAQRKPRDLHVGGYVAFVLATDSGYQFRLDNCELTPGEARKLARWILDTFGESSEPSSRVSG